MHSSYSCILLSFLFTVHQIVEMHIHEHIPLERSPPKRIVGANGLELKTILAMNFLELYVYYTRSIVLPRHHPFESPSFPITNTWHPCLNGNWFGSCGLKSYNAVATTSRNGHDNDWFKLIEWEMEKIQIIVSFL